MLKDRKLSAHEPKTAMKVFSKTTDMGLHPGLLAST